MSEPRTLHILPSGAWDTALAASVPFYFLTSEEVKDATINAIEEPQAVMIAERFIQTSGEGIALVGRKLAGCYVGYENNDWPSQRSPKGVGRSPLLERFIAVDEFGEIQGVWPNIGHALRVLVASGLTFDIFANGNPHPKRSEAVPIPVTAVHGSACARCFRRVTRGDLCEDCGR